MASAAGSGAREPGEALSFPSKESHLLPFLSGSPDFTFKNSAMEAIRCKSLHGREPALTSYSLRLWDDQGQRLLSDTSCFNQESERNSLSPCKQSQMRLKSAELKTAEDREEINRWFSNKTFSQNLMFWKNLPN